MTNQKELLLRHSIASERKRYAFITSYNVACNLCLKDLLAFSQTGDEKFVRDFYERLHTLLLASCTKFLKGFGYEN